MQDVKRNKILIAAIVNTLASKRRVLVERAEYRFGNANRQVANSIGAFRETTLLESWEQK